MSRIPVAYSSLTSIRGPLVLVEGVEGVGWDEVAEIRADSGPPRHGVGFALRCVAWRGYIRKCSPRYTLRTSALVTISPGVPSASTLPSLMM